MNSACIQAEKVHKKFKIIKRHKTTFRFLKALINKEPLYRDLWALKDISFKIMQGESVALIGDNGSGKSTLLRLLAGIYEKTSGLIEIESEIAALFNIGTGFSGDLSVWDNVYLYGAYHGVPRKKLDTKMHHILKRADLHGLAAAPYKELSSGQRQRLGLSVFFETERDTMIFDECLSYVDVTFRKWCLDKLKEMSQDGTRTLLLVSHDMDFLKQVCQRAIWLEKGRVVQTGTTADVIDAYLGSKSKIV